MSNCKNCDCDNQNEDSSSGFIFGLLLGCIIGAVIAVLIYKHNKGEVFKLLQSKLEPIFNPSTQNPVTKSPASPSKISVIIPPRVVRVSTPVKPSSVRKNNMFVKPKK